MSEVLSAEAQDEAEKREKKERRRKEREAKRAQEEAERIELERRLFGVNPNTLVRSASGTCPTRPEIGLWQMEMDEQRAMALVGTCRGGMQHSGANM